MINFKRRWLSALTALMLVFSLFALLPQGAFQAYALSGSGTESDPYIVTTYDELRSLLNCGKIFDDTTRYIKLGQDIISNDSNNDYDFTLICGHKFDIILDLAGHSLSRSARTLDGNLFTIGYNSKLTINDSVGTGVISSNLNCGNQISNLFYLEKDGELVINSGTIVTLRNSDYSENCIAVEGGTVTVNGGVLKSNNAAIYGHLGNITLNGGEYVQTKDMGNYMVQGICVYKGCTTAINNCKLVATAGSAKIFTSNDSLKSVISLDASIKVDGEIVTLTDSTKRLKGTEIIIKSPTKVKNVNITVTEPKAGEIPDYNPVCSSEGVTANGAIWSKVNSEESTTQLTGDDKFEAGCKYVFKIFVFPASTDYKLDDDMTVTINGKQVTGGVILGIGLAYIEFEVPTDGHRQVGDVNNDGKITADDAIIVARFAAGYPGYSTKYDADIADMNRDGNVTADDAIIIARYAAGYPSYAEKYTKYV